MIEEKAMNKLVFREPSFKLFRKGEIVCVVLRLPTFGNWNGYCGVGKNHKLFGLDYNDDSMPEILVHGGLTYADKELLPVKEFFKDLWWFGFDTVHLGDSYGWGNSMDTSPGSSYKTFDYVVSETESLAEQLEKVK